MKKIFLSKRRLLSILNDLLHSTNITLTRPRLLICQAINKSNEHPDAFSILREVSKFTKLSLDTLYRSLKFLEDLGIVRKVDSFTNKARFEIWGKEHQHFICTKCNKIIDVKFYKKRKKFPRYIYKYGIPKYEAYFIIGICKQCLKLKNTESKPHNNYQ